jgi:hypothetical protein
MANQNFTITPGGRHADGKTENKLICFQDGSYIELIAFIDDDPKHREGHWWGDKKPGIIDFAFTTDEDAKTHYEAMKVRLQKLGEGKESVSYAPPAAGGRRRDDGEEVKWQVTFPENVKRGELPFFCHDVTPRQLRVPISAESVQHPNTAYGIKSMSIMVPHERANHLAKMFSAVLNVENVAEEPGMGVFTVGRMHAVEYTSDPTLHVRWPAEDEEGQKQSVAKRGVLLGDLVVGGISILGGTENSMRLGREEDMGRILWKLDLPAGLAGGNPEGVTDTATTAT